MIIAAKGTVTMVDDDQILFAGFSRIVGKSLFHDLHDAAPSRAQGCADGH
jgi:hypothetical protein